MKVVGTVPNDTHKAITYPAALASTTQNAEEAQAFLDWCQNDPQRQEIWQKWGFELTEQLSASRELRTSHRMFAQPGDLVSPSPPLFL